MLGYKDTHRYSSFVNAESDDGMVPVNWFLLRYLQSKQARLVVDEKDRLLPQGDSQSTWPLETWH